MSWTVKCIVVGGHLDDDRHFQELHLAMLLLEAEIAYFPFSCFFIEVVSPFACIYCICQSLSSLIYGA